MNETEQFLQQRRLDIALRDQKSAHAKQFNEKLAGSGGSEPVAFTSHTGSGGDEATLANFAYTFTDSFGNTHTDIAPTQQRPFGTLLPATHGDWFPLQQILKNVDEVADTGVCSASAQVATAGDAPFFGW
jgi:hypothetical protein